MLINIIYFRPRVPMIVEPMVVANTSIVGPTTHPRVTQQLEATRVQNTSQVFGGDAIISIGHNLFPARIVNTSSITNKTARVSHRYLRPARVANASTIGSPTVLADKFVAPNTVHNVSTFGTPHTVITKRYLRPTRLANSNTITNKTARVAHRYLRPTRLLNTSTLGSPVVALVAQPAVWSTVDKDSITLSNSNRTATASASGDHGLRAAAIQYSGLYYFEITTGATFAGANSGFGVASAGARFSSVTDRRPNGSNVVGVNGVLAAQMFKSGSVFVNGSSVGVITGGISASKTYGIAVNFTTRKIAFRNVTDAGNWNANVANSPATGAFDISSIDMLGLFPSMSTSGSGDVATINCGSAAFVGSVPTGYTSGWPQNNSALQIDPASINTNEVQSSAANITLSVTTQGTCDLVIVVATEKDTALGGVVSTVSGGTIGSLTKHSAFHTKPGAGGTDQDILIEIWYKRVTGALTGETITVTFAGTNDKATILSMGIRNADTSVFDGNVSLPATSSNGASNAPSVSGLSTTNAPAILFGAVCATHGADFTSSSAGGTANALIGGFFNHTGGDNWCALHVIGRYVTAAQSGVAVTPGTMSASDQWIMTADAIRK